MDSWRGSSPINYWPLFLIDFEGAVSMWEIHSQILFSLFLLLEPVVVVVAAVVVAVVDCLKLAL